MGSNIGIYKITSPTNKVYIGQSWDLKKRESDYKVCDCRNQTFLYNSINKYGWETHEFTVLMYVSENIPQKNFDEIEQAFMDYYRRNGIQLLNIREAGSRGKHSEESKKKMGLAKKKSWKCPEFQEKMNKKLIRMRKPIHQFDRDGQFIKEWGYSKLVSMELMINAGHVTECCNNKRKSAGGYIWKYKETN